MMSNYTPPFQIVYSATYTPHYYPGNVFSGARPHSNDPRQYPNAGSPPGGLLPSIHSQLDLTAHHRNSSSSGTTDSYESSLPVYPSLRHTPANDAYGAQPVPPPHRFYPSYASPGAPPMDANHGPYPAPPPSQWLPQPPMAYYHHPPPPLYESPPYPPMDRGFPPGPSGGCGNMPSYNPTPYNPNPYNPNPYNPNPYNPNHYNPNPYDSNPYNPMPYVPNPAAPTFYPSHPPPYAGQPPQAPEPYVPRPFLKPDELESLSKALRECPPHLPSLPSNGQGPSTHSMSSSENQPPRRNRGSPSVVQSPAFGISGYNMFTPAQTNGRRDYKTQPGSMRNSPMNFGGPLGTPNGNILSPGLQQTPFMPSPGGVLQTFTTNPIIPTPYMSPAMDPNKMTGNYGPAAAGAAAVAAGNFIGRTVYVGNLPPDASVDELLNLVRFGPIEEVKIYVEKPSVFISFLDGSTAAAFHADACVKKLALRGQELRIGWGKASWVPKWIAQAVDERQATRCLYLGGLPESINEQDLRDVCEEFGPIDQVKVVRDRACGFVHFLSIATTMKAVKHLPKKPEWADRRVGFGHDRCAYVPKAQQPAVRKAKAQAAAAVVAQHVKMHGSPFATPFTPIGAGIEAFGSPLSPAFGSPSFPSALFGPVDENATNRNVYLGNIHPDTTFEELLNPIKSGMIYQVRIIRDKGCAFVTFVEHQAAVHFIAQVNGPGITVNSRRLKANWGGKVLPLSQDQRTQIQQGASRTVYVGIATRADEFTEQRLRDDFSRYGEIEMINFAVDKKSDKKSAFVNYTSILYAQKAVAGAHVDLQAYDGLRVAFGRDRCNPMYRHNNNSGSNRSSPDGPSSGHIEQTMDPQNVHVIYDPDNRNAMDGLNVEEADEGDDEADEPTFTIGDQPGSVPLANGNGHANGHVQNGVHEQDELAGPVAGPSGTSATPVVAHQAVEGELYDLEDADEPLVFD